MHGGGFSLIRLFTSFAMLGAEWVMWVLVVLSVASVAVMLERGRYYRSLNDDLDKLADDLRALLRKGDLDGARKRWRSPPPPRHPWPSRASPRPIRACIHPRRPWPARSRGCG
ncbi:MAG: hypothetical protein U0325_18545 [Polyangiales bacterium]